jgi:hypothetical protein
VHLSIERQVQDRKDDQEEANDKDDYSQIYRNQHACCVRDLLGLGLWSGLNVGKCFQVESRSTKAVRLSFHANWLKSYKFISVNSKLKTQH